MRTSAALLKAAAVLVAVAAVAGGLVIYAGLIPVAADAEHRPFSQWPLQTARERSVARAARAVEVKLPRQRVVVVALGAMAFGLGYTVFSECLNVTLRQSWAYRDIMPRLPFLGTGLSPLLQWLVIPALAYVLAWKAESGEHESGAESCRLTPGTDAVHRSLAEQQSPPD